MDVITIHTAPHNMRNKFLATLFRIMQEDQNELNVLGYYLSFICTVLSEKAGEIRGALRDSNFEVIEGEYPTDLSFQDYEPSEIRSISAPEVLAVFGVLVLVAFKHSNEKNHENFFSARERAIAGTLGCKAERIGIIFSLNKARFIMTIVGDIRKILLLFILSNEAKSEKMTNKVCGYLANILKWTDMIAFQFIRDALWRTCSPVLYHPDVLPETQNFSETIMKISTTEHYPYFRFLGPSDEQYLIEKNRFSTLFAVAVKLLEGRIKSVSNSENINALVKLHKYFTATDTKAPVDLLELEPKEVDHRLFHAQQTRELLKIKDSDMDTLEWICNMQPGIMLGEKEAEGEVDLLELEPKRVDHRRELLKLCDSDIDTLERIRNMQPGIMLGEEAEGETATNTKIPVVLLELESKRVDHRLFQAQQTRELLNIQDSDMDTLKRIRDMQPESCLKRRKQKEKMPRASHH